MRTWFPLLGLILICAGMARAAGPSADDYLHGSGGKYIQGRLQEAMVEVEEGLGRFPGDARLKSLADQLKKMQDQKKKDQGGSGSQNSPDQGKPQDQKDSSDQASEGQKDQDQKAKDEEKAKQEEKEKQAKQDQAGEQPQSDQDKREEDKGDSSGQAPSPVKPGQMSKEEAERLLNSYQDDEKREHEQMQQRQRKATDVEKDW